MALPSTHPSALPFTGFDLDESSRSPSEEGPRCDACDEIIAGEPGGYGCYLWTRGDHVEEERPPLCESCATAIGISANAWLAEEEEDG